MKKSITTIASFVLVIAAFTSCKKEASDQPVNAINANSAIAPGSIVPVLPHQLTKRGSDTIIYDAGARVSKVQDEYRRTEYTYGVNTVNTKTYDKQNRLDDDVTYKLDPATGRAIESSHTHYAHYSMGDVTDVLNLTYQYDANGRLVKKINKDKPLERDSLTYSANGRLSSMMIYASTGSFSARIDFNYEFTAGTAITDRIKLNPEYMSLDIYLKIFGKFSDALVVEYTTTGSHRNKTADEWHQYTMNANGYPSLLVKKSLMQNNYGYVLSTLPFAYQMSTL